MELAKDTAASLHDHSEAWADDAAEYLRRAVYARPQLLQRLREKSREWDASQPFHDAAEAARSAMNAASSQASSAAHSLQAWTERNEAAAKETAQTAGANIASTATSIWDRLAPSSPAVAASPKRESETERRREAERQGEDEDEDLPTMGDTLYSIGQATGEAAEGAAHTLSAWGSTAMHRMQAGSSAIAATSQHVVHDMAQAVGHASATAARKIEASPTSPAKQAQLRAPASTQVQASPVQASPVATPSSAQDDEGSTASGHQHAAEPTSPAAGTSAPSEDSSTLKHVGQVIREAVADAARAVADKAEATAKAMEAEAAPVLAPEEAESKHIKQLHAKSERVLTRSQAKKLRKEQA